MLRNRGHGSLPSHGGSNGGYDQAYGGYSAGNGGGETYGSAYGGYSGGNGYNGGGYNGGGYSGGYAGHSTTTPSSTSSPSKRRNSSSSSPSSNILAVIGSVILTFICFSLAMYYRSVSNSLLHELGVANKAEAMEQKERFQSEISRWKKQVDTTKYEIQRKFSTQISQLEKDKRSIQKERDELLVKHESPEKIEEGTMLVAREEAWKEQVMMLQDYTRQESKRSVLDKFGPGPHKVEFTILLPAPTDSDPEKLSEETFIVQMAPLDAVPHAVHFFMEQVAHGLWNGCYLYLNGPHVLQVGPQYFDEDEDGTAHADDEAEDDDEDPRGPVMRKFREKRLDELAFPDYSETYPHEAWTLGFAGRPGGPDFYINKVDNVKAHGPGGQFQHVLGEEQGDSCFATIVSGRETVAKVYQQPTFNDRTEWHYFIQDPIEIKQAVVVGWTPEGNHDNSTDAGNRKPRKPLAVGKEPGNTDMEVTTIGAETTNVDVPNFVADTLKLVEKVAEGATEEAATTTDKTAASNSEGASDTTKDSSSTASDASDKAKVTTPVTDEKDPVLLISEKLKRKPRLPKIHHQVEP